jgi:hypothetical protein
MALLVTARGPRVTADMSITPEWVVGLPGEKLQLRLFGVCQANVVDLYYLFCPERAAWQGFLEERPLCMAELLVPLPMLPLRRSARGFHMLSKADWDVLLQEEETVPSLSRAGQRSLLSMPPDPDEDGISWRDESLADEAASLLGDESTPSESDSPSTEGEDELINSEEEGAALEVGVLADDCAGDVD